MLRRWFASPWWVPIGIGLGLLAAYLPLAGWLAWVALAAGLLATGGGLAGLVLQIVSVTRAGAALGDRLAALAGGRHAHIRSHWLTTDRELDDALDYVREVVGDPPGTFARPTLRLLLRRNGRLAFGLFLPPHENLIGLLVGYPITARARTHLLAGEIVGSSQLLPEHVCRNWARASAIYLSFVGGKGLIARAAVMSAIRVIFQEQSHLDFFTRPITADGMRVARVEGFRPIASSPVWVRFGDDPAPARELPRR